MKKLFVSSDIHGFYKEWKKSLKNVNFDLKNENHIIVICGDLLDRGKEASSCIHFLYKMMKKNRAIFIRGNHEDLYENMLRNGIATNVDRTNGTLDTLLQVRDNEKDIEQWKYLRDNSLNYFETKNYIFVHGWIPVFKGLYVPRWRDCHNKSWEEARWLNGMAMAEQGILEPNKTIICGHWHTSYGNSFAKYGVHLNKYEFSDLLLFKPYYNNGIIAIDGCVAFTKFVNTIVLEVDDDEIKIENK